MEGDELSPNLVPLSKLLPSPYHIVYASLLLAFSVPVAFAGAFLTLDRTRSFAPSGLVSTPLAAKKSNWRLEGGVGGLLSGWLVGVHSSTLIALLIVNRTSAAQLGSIQFLLVWLLSGLALSAISGRWKLVAIFLIGLGGGGAFSLFVAVVCHPEKLARSILLGICATISTILCLLPIPKVQHGAVRSASAWLGALGIILAISILTGTASDWTDVWARLWVSWDPSWGTGMEKGLSAAFVCLALVGMAVDWLLKRQFGECPDEKWDSYLANYAANLNVHDRPGTFAPTLPFWKKLFNLQPKDPILFPPDKALLSTRGPLSPPPYQTGKLRSKSKKSGGWSGNSSQPLNKAGRHNLSSDTDSSSSSEEGFGEDGKRYIPRPWAQRKDTQATTLSGATLADTASASSKGKRKGPISEAEKDLENGGEIMYSDGEEATASISPKRKTQREREVPGWTPEFIKRHSVNGKRGDELEMKSTSTTADSPPPGAVPVTPSLMRALDRVSQAQNEAYGGIISKGHTPYASTPGHGGAGASAPGLPPMQMPTPSGGYDWAGFWRTVEDKTTGATPSTQPKPAR